MDYHNFKIMYTIFYHSTKFTTILHIIELIVENFASRKGGDALQLQAAQVPNVAPVGLNDRRGP